jgi:uncharacterized protein (TIGR00251 family)
VSGKPYAATEGGVRLAVRVTPRASRSGLDGVVADAKGRMVLKIRLAAPPVDGAANTALIDFVADALSLRKADVQIRAGHTGRNKQLDLSGDPGKLLQRLDFWLSGGLA